MVKFASKAGLEDMKWWRLLFDLCFPKCCAVCGVQLNYHEHHLCLECYADLPLTHFWNVQDNPAERTFWGRCKLERVFSLFYYTNNYRKPVHELKYNGNTAIGLWLGEMLGRHIASAENFPPVDFIVPVPLHWKKRLTRGYNQSEIIAKGIAKGLKTSGAGTPPVLGNLLKRAQFTKTQTAKDRIDRWHNVSSAFRPNPKSKVIPPPDSHLLLVDDVVTTGATLEACASILVEQLGCRVSIATLAYVE